MNKFLTRNEIQEILETNSLNAEVSYVDRINKDSPLNYIVYYRLNPNNTNYSDNNIHMRKAMVQVSHYHKKTLDSISDLMFEYFGVEPIEFNLRQMDTDYLNTVYRFEIWTDGENW